MRTDNATNTFQYWQYSVSASRLSRDESEGRSMLTETERKRLKVLQEVLAKAHSDFLYATDLQTHGVLEHWAAELIGDCDSFTLWCRDELKARGIESDLILCKTSNLNRHLVLSVDGWILDNLSYYVQRRDDLDYIWIKIGKPDGTWLEIV